MLTKDTGTGSCPAEGVNHFGSPLSKRLQVFELFVHFSENDGAVLRLVAPIHSYCIIHLWYVSAMK